MSESQQDAMVEVRLQEAHALLVDIESRLRREGMIGMGLVALAGVATVAIGSAIVRTLFSKRHGGSK